MKSPKINNTEHQLHELLNSKVDDDNTYYQIATLYNKIKKYKESERYYIMAIEKGNINAMNDIGNLYLKLKKYDKAEKYYKMAIEKDDNMALYYLANLYLEIRKYDQAEKYYKMAIEKGNVSAMNNLGYLYKQLGRYDEAMEYYKMACINDHKNINYWKNIEDLKKETSTIIGGLYLDESTIMSLAIFPNSYNIAINMH